jgi:CubicO group peptidase (beta-lactamase class C family)
MGGSRWYRNNKPNQDNFTFCRYDSAGESAARLMDLDLQVRQLLNEGMSSHLFSGAAAALITPAHGLIATTVGTHAYDDSRKVTPESLFDLASVSKTIVAAAILSLVEEGLIDPDEPIACHMAVGSGPGADSITLRHLLTHTAGLPSDVFVWKDTDISQEERLAIALASPLESFPDAIFHYSCLGYIAAGKLAEHVSGKSLSGLVAERVTAPLGLETMTFGPVVASQTVATEDESYIGRGMVRGEVHDELAWSLGGQVGNAGIFATSSDLLTFARIFLREGHGNRRQVLGERGIRLMTQSTLRPEHGAQFGHGMGLRIADAGFMGAVQGMGHTGFTGTMFVVDRLRESVSVLLTNRVHPSREKVDLSSFRVRFNNLIANAVDAS